MPDPLEWLEGLDAPLALPTSLRDRLEQQLLGSATARPLDLELTQRLTDRLADPIADRLHDLDAPRPLAPELRATLLADLAPGRRRRVAWAIAAASSAAVLVVALVLAPSGSGPVSHQAGPAPTILPSVVPTPPVSAAPSPGRSALPVSGPPLVPVPVGAPLGPGSVTGGGDSPALTPADSYGYYTPPQPYAAADLPIGGSYRPAPTPEVTSRTPDAGPLAGGTIVHISGTLLHTAETVTFGEAAGQDFRVIDDHHLSVVSPSHAAGLVSFVVHFADGGTFTVNAGFSYLKAPTITALTPNTGATAGGTWVVIDGEALSRVTTVSFGGTPAPNVEVVSDKQLRVMTPPHGLGPADVTVASPGGTSNAVRFVFLP